MTKNGMVLKLTKIMKRHGRSEEEIKSERRNIVDWFDTCKGSSLEELQKKEAYLMKSLDCARKVGDQAYLETRHLFLDIVWEQMLPLEINFKGGLI